MVVGGIAHQSTIIQVFEFVCRILLVIIVGDVQETNWFVSYDDFLLCDG
jgi:hypothetical protein